MICRARSGTGAKCRAHAVRNSKFCLLHHKGTAAKLGSKGGRRRARYDPSLLAQTGEPRTAADVCRVLATSVTELRSGVLDPRMATAIGYLATALLKALESADFEKRLSKLESRAAQVPTNQAQETHAHLARTN